MANIILSCQIHFYFPSGNTCSICTLQFVDLVWKNFIPLIKYGNSGWVTRVQEKCCIYLRQNISAIGHKFANFDVCLRQMWVGREARRLLLRLIGKHSRNPQPAFLLKFLLKFNSFPLGAEIRLSLKPLGLVGEVCCFNRTKSKTNIATGEMSQVITSFTIYGQQTFYGCITFDQIILYGWIAYYGQITF